MAIPTKPTVSLVDTGNMQGGSPMDLNLPEVEVDIPTEEQFEGGAEILQDVDGGAIIRALSEKIEEEVEELIPHEANLAEFLDEGYLGEISSELRGYYEDDLESRSEWEETYTKGLDQLGIRYEERTEPFQGASSVTHPLIVESVTQFQAQSYKELIPSGGPIRTYVLGDKTPEKESQAKRVEDFMNYQVMEVMEEYDPDMDQLLFYLPLSGSAFKIVYYDEARQRAVSKFVPAQDLVVPYMATDLQTSSRVTHVLRMDMNEVKKLQVSGFYRDIDITPSDSEMDQVQDKVNEVTGVYKSYSDDVFNLLEMHVDLDLEGFEDMSPEGQPTGIQLPYIVTLDNGSGKILSIRRNFDEGTRLAKKKQYFVHYKFMPGLGFYGFGLIHMIGGLGRAATSILRQLIDAGTLSNLPAGFKARGVRVRNDDEPLQPGEFRDIDAPGGNITQSIIPLPYKEPSGTLASLLGSLIEGGRRFIALADEKTGSMNSQAPVGTTVALLERGMRVMSAIHKRLHYAQKTEFKILARIFSQNLPDEYPYQVTGADRSVKAVDFDDKVDVIPVSDPNIFSMAQRVTLAQTQLQLAQANPQIHNLTAAYKRMYQALEVDNIDEILPPPPEPQPLDPVIENARALMGETLRTFPDQDHDAHINIHLVFMKTPLVSTSPQVMGTFYAHLLEHVSQKSRQVVIAEIEKITDQVQAGVDSGTIDPIAAQTQILELERNLQDPGELEKLISLQQKELMDDLIPKLFTQGEGSDPMSDPLVQIRLQELGIKQQTEQRKAAVDQAELQLQASKLQQQAATDAARIESTEEIAANRNQVNRERIDVQRQSVLNKRGR